MASYKNGSITLENVYGKKTYETTIAECGSSTELQELTITENGTYTAPEGTAYTPVNVNVPSKEEETKSITITENGTTTVLPTSGKVLSKVDIVANVPQSVASGTVKKLLDATKTCHNFFEKYYGRSVDDLISYNDTENVTDMSFMFSMCYYLTSVPLLNTSNVTNMHAMFQGCTRLTSLPLFNTSKVTDMGGMLYECDNLKTIPQLDTSNVTTMLNMCQKCDMLTSVSELNTSNVTNMTGIFDSCPELKTVAQLDLIKSTSNSSMFRNCRSLTYLKLLNIKINLQIGSGTSWGHLIEKDCLIQIISELIKPLSGTRTLTMGTANKAKIADTYVKLLADDGTGKYPFEVCDSTTEGAMTIEAYCNSKNWTLA